MKGDTIIEKKGEYAPSEDLLHGANVLLKHSVEDKVDGSYYSLMSSLLFAAFSIEAFLNRVGIIIVGNGWSDFEKAPVLAKLRYVNTVLGFKNDFSQPPLQNFNRLFKFRNKLAHPRSQDVNESVVKKSDKVTCNDIYSAPRPTWMKGIVEEKEVRSIIKDVETYTQKVRSLLSEPQLTQLESESHSGSVSRNYSDKNK